MKIGMRGSGLSVRIPAAIVRELNLRPGDEAELASVGEHSFEIRRVPPLASAMQQAVEPGGASICSDDGSPRQPTPAKIS